MVAHHQQGLNFAIGQGEEWLIVVEQLLDF